MTSSISRFATNVWGHLPNKLNQVATAAYFKGFIIIRFTGKIKFRNERGTAILNVGVRGTHSVTKNMSQIGFQVKILPALSDNYMYLIVDEATNEAAIVDPVAPETVVAAVKEQNVNLTTVLTTHHHWDHAGGNKQLKQMMPDLLVYGGDERIDCLTKKVSHDDHLKIGSLGVKCLFTPCHTTGHICYYVTSKIESGGESKAVFTGDTLFMGGCGRFFEGTPDQMNTALNEILGCLPDDTNVYCGHEYTTANLKFGLHVEPENEDILKALKEAQELRSMLPPVPTVPSTIGKEKLINPFMRVDKTPVREHSGNTTSNIETMRFLRTEKDSFKPT